MKRYTLLLIVSLLCCLLIYIFYRTDKTLVNQLIIALISKARYSGIKESVSSMIPLKDYIVYSLPEGLWVFCITLTTSFFYLEVNNRKWNLFYLPLMLAVIIELFQLFHLTNGRFDLMDITFACGFWLLARFCTRSFSEKEPLFQSFNIKTFTCMFSYSIVYLSHVTY